MIYLYASSIYTENDITVVLYETSSIYTNLQLEKYLRNINIISEAQEVNSTKSYLRVSYPTNDIRNIKVKIDEWYRFPKKYFATVEEYRLIMEDEAGATILRADIKFKNIPNMKPRHIKSSNRKMLMMHLDKIRADKFFNSKSLSYIYTTAKLANAEIGVKNEEEDLLFFKKGVLKEIRKYVKKNDANGFIELLSEDSNGDYVISNKEKEAIEETIDYKNNLNKIREEYGISSVNKNILNKKPECLIINVVNCKHGNWNEIKTESFSIIYDVGASNSLTENEIKDELIEKRISNFNSNNHLVISHWDTDHYQSILHFNNEHFKKFSYVYLPNPIKKKENQNTILKAFSIISNKYLKFGAHEKRSLFLFNQSKNQNRTRHTSITKSIVKISDNIILHLGNLSQDSNKSGLILHLKDGAYNAILPADHTWMQIKDALASLPENSKENLMIVTPHHGGAAGSLKPLEGLSGHYNIKLITSCDEKGNGYGHPQSEFINLVTSLGLLHKRTDKDCDGILGKAITCAFDEKTINDYPECFV